MRLVKLSANKKSFKTVAFNRTGLSLVVAEQHESGADQTSTYNGVGKSLMFSILHYCLGSNKIDAFAKHLKGWAFSLTIEADDRHHVITRSADDPKSISLDGEEISLTKLREVLQGWSFGIPAGTKHLTFRSLISRFIRSGRSAYNEFLIADGGETKAPYQAMLRSAFLLGLDLEFARTKFELRTREQSLKQTMDKLQKDPVFAPLIAENAVEIESESLREEVDRLRRDLNAFKVADDYREIELEADRVKRELGVVRREATSLDEAISQIDRSLSTKIDLSAQRVIALYQEAQALLPEMVTRRIEEVLAFQEELQRKRVLRLTKDRQRLMSQHKAAAKMIASLSGELDRQLRYLGDHHALDEYLAVSERLREVQHLLAKVEDSKTLRDTVDRELKTISRDMAEGNIDTDEYLESAKALIDEASSLFRAFARDLYGNRRSGLVIANDSGTNTLRYKIDAHITADAAEGINEAKIFCFDLTLLALARGHRVKFLAHDSTLFGPIDPRQTLSMFRAADRVCREHDLQYIAALNLHDITPITEQVGLEKDEYDKLFGDAARVLRLTDESRKTKLLGIDVDMNYSKS